MKISDNIKELMICFIKNSVITTSWGISDISISKSSLHLNVCGFNYSGKIIIEVLADGKYSITTEQGVNLVSNTDQIIEQLDTFIERSNGYNEKLKDWIKNELERHESTRMD